jgi:hypothetical protein
LPSQGTIGKPGPSPRLPCIKVGNLHAVSQSHFAWRSAWPHRIAPGAGPTGLIATILMHVEALALYI